MEGHNSTTEHCLLEPRPDSHLHRDPFELPLQQNRTLPIQFMPIYKTRV